MNWLYHLFHHFPVLCLGLASFPPSDGKPHGPSEPLEAPTPAMRSEVQNRATGFQDSWFDANVDLVKLQEIASKVAETAKKQN